MNKAIFFFFCVATLAVVINAKYCANTDGSCAFMQTIGKENATSMIARCRIGSDSCPEDSKCVLINCQRNMKRVKRQADIDLNFLRFGK